MITLEGNIEVKSANFGVSVTPNSEYEGNNISTSLKNALQSQSRGSNPFLLGVSTFSDNATFSDNVDYFISKQVSDGDGKFANPFILTVATVLSMPTTVTIYFDTHNGRYPKSLFVDGVERKDNDAIYTIDNVYNGTEIRIDNWSEPNRPLVITGMEFGAKIKLDRRNLISASAVSSDRGDYKMPSFGIISNGGNVEFNDYNGEVLDYAEQGWLTEGLTVKLYILNTLTKKKEQIAEFYTDTWGYDNDNRSASVSLKDDLVEWQDINVSGIAYDGRKPYRYFRTAEDLYKIIKGVTPAKYNMLSWEELDFDTKMQLSNIVYQYPVLETGTLWQQWTKFCYATQCRIYKENNKTILKYNGGN